MWRIADWCRKSVIRYTHVHAEVDAPFMKPFTMAGSVDIYPASTCAAVVARGGCATSPPAIDDTVPALDPEEACQRAIDAGLVVHRAHPLNCETSIPALVGGVVMPNAHFYVRNHFQIPTFAEQTWRPKIGGLVERLAARAGRTDEPVSEAYQIKVKGK